MTEPSRVVAIVTRESVGGARAEGGDERGGGGQVDVGDGGAVRSELALVRGLVAPSLSARAWTTSPTADPATVYAAASLTDVFPKVSPSSRFQFAGSNQLALQITRGAPADVFASASPVYTQDLFRNGLVEKPRTFATNSLVLAIPRSNPAKIRTV